MNTSFKILIAVFISCTVLLFACRKPDNNPQTAIFGLHLHTYIDTNLVSPSGVPNVYQQEYPDANGRWEYLTQANVYITNVNLHSTTKGWVSINGSILLKRIENELYVLGNVNADTYDNVRFTVGLGPNYDNSSAPTSGADSVLSTSSEAVMYNGASNGYYFLSLKGFVDTSAGQADSGHIAKNPISFSIQLGGMGDTVQVSPPTASGGNTFTLQPNQQGPQLVHIIFDYGKLLQSFPITVPTTVNSFTTPATATPVWNNVQNMFRYECSVPNGDC